MSTANQVTTDTVVSALNEYAFLHVWNEIRAEYRVNIRLSAVTDRFATGQALGREVIPLPTLKDQYAVFQTATRFFDNGLSIPSDTWLNTMDVINQYGIMLHVYPDSGLMVPKKGVYIRRSSKKNRVYVAVQKEPLLKVTSLSTYKELYLTLYRDSDLEHPITCQSFHLPVGSSLALAAQIEAAVRQSLAESPHGTMLFINGYEIDPIKGIPYTFGDYVEVITDRNVVGSYTVNLTEQQTGYHSEVDGIYKEVLHCPKALNPTNKLITHNTVTLFVRSNRENRGVYLHRCDDLSVGQLTHNDLSVATHVVNAHRDFLRQEDVSVHVLVRTHSKDNVLMRDSHFIDYLYLCDDTTIIQHLRGKIDADLDFWSAAMLEKSIYVRMMFDTPNIITPTVLDDYIKGLGYHTTTSILCQHLQSQTLQADKVGNLSFLKPVIYRGVTTRVEAFLDGRKVNHTQVKVIDHGHSTVRVAFDDTVYSTKGQTVTVNILEAGDAQPYLFTPKPGSTYIEVPFAGVRIFERIELGVDIVKGWKAESPYSYKELSLKAGTLMTYPTDSGGTQVVCGQSLYDKTLVVVNSRYYHQTNYDLSEAYTNREPLVVQLRIAAENDLNTLVPLLGYSSLDLYLNGRYLIKGIDYTDVPGTDRDGNLAFTEILITNREYLSDTGTNMVEVISHTSKTLSDECGYVFEGKASYDTDINTWYAGVSQLYVSGRLVLNLEDKGSYLQLDPSTPNASPFYLTTTIPESLSYILKTHSPAQDVSRIRKINAYFAEEGEVDKSFILIPNSHDVYSPYLVGILHDINSGKCEPVAEPDTSAFLAQFYPYLYLKQRDPCLNPAISKIDTRYVDLYPTYAETTVPDPATFKIVRRLTKLVLGEDKDTLGDVTDG